MKGKLYAYDVITRDEKTEIDRLIGVNQMQRVLNIVSISLDGKQPAKYKGFLQAMEESEDILLKAKAKELGKLINIVCTHERNYWFICTVLLKSTFTFA